MKHTVTAVSKDRWVSAQKFELEFARASIESDDDWNKWWVSQFDQYSELHQKTFPNVLEVGCGPHTNLRYILPHINYDHIFLEDPLIQYYLIGYSLENTGFFKKKHQTFIQKLFLQSKPVDVSSAPLEDLTFHDSMMNLVVCINVLDHIRDMEQCIRQMARVSSPGALLLLGQDLSNDEDFQRQPDSWEDAGHPMKVDEEILDSFLEKYQFMNVTKKILPREEGRNPPYHYGTYIGILQKRV